MSGPEKSKTCFVISPIGSEGTETRKRADQVFKHVIEPATSQCGYRAIRADQIPKPGIITSQVIQHLIEDPLVVADLAEPNPNVFYELAIRHAARKPVIEITQKGKAIPFDVSQTRVIQLDHTDLDSAALGRQDLVKQIQSAEKDPDVDNPVSTAIDLQLLRQSGSPLEKSLALIVSMVSDVRLAIEEITPSKDLQSLRTRKKIGFKLTLPDSVFGELEKIATARGITVEDLIRTVIMPEWTAEAELQSTLLGKKAVVDRQLEALKGTFSKHIFSASLSDGAAGEPGFVVVSDKVDKTIFFDVYLKGGFVSGSSEEVLGTLEQVVRGIQGKAGELKAWMESPSADKSAFNR